MLRVRVVVAVVAAFVVGLFASSAVMFVWPGQDRVTRADAVVVLAGSHSRLDRALELIGRHVAPVLVISDGRAKEWLTANKLCAVPQAFKVICFRSNPYSTRGEAEELRRLAARHHWRTLVVVTSTYHVTRARMLLQRCLTGRRVEVVGVPFSWTKLPVLLASEWSKLIYALTVAREC